MKSYRATQAPTWEDVWDIVKPSGRDSVGLYLDTFQTAGGEWANPTTKSGRSEFVSEAGLDTKCKTGIGKIFKTIPKDKTYIFRISDAYKPIEPLDMVTDVDRLQPRGK